ncbi:MAG: chorismate synthase [Candidatus Cloacimonetes bacterium]|nr:chorismate synthase [Candidatus Cloacimonadota bacterium]
MQGNHFGRYFGITSFGESHGPVVGVLLEDVLPGIDFPYEAIRKELERRKPGNGEFSSSRIETDEFEILSGVFEGKTTGMPICIIVKNRDARTGDYDFLRDVFRPGHADYSLYKKFKIYDYRGGGRLSGRETVARVIAGNIPQALLKDISFSSYSIQIGKIKAGRRDISFINQNKLFWSDKSNYYELKEWLEDVKKEGNSCGGIVEVVVRGLPAGLGDPVFEKLDANIAKAVMSVGAVKGIEFGKGFSLAELSGYEANDTIIPNESSTNNCGGILGGISTGGEIVFRYVVKPVPSIKKTQLTTNISGESLKISVTGRHDICIIPRVIPVVEAMVKLVLTDAISYQKMISEQSHYLADFRDSIDKIDEEIIMSIYRRQQISEFVGKYKEINNLPIDNPEREKQIIERIENLCKLLELPEKEVEQIWQILFRCSKQRQNSKC